MTNLSGGFTPASKLEGLLHGVTHFNHAAIMIQSNKTIYIDPYKLPDSAPDADLIFITHEHFDHFSAEDLAKISKPDTTVVVPESMAPQCATTGIATVVPVLPGKEYQVNGICFRTVAAYNINKQFHPKTNNWVGYLIQLNNNWYYHAGDTDLVPEMSQVKADVAFLPVGGTYTTTAEEAAQAAAIIKPAVAVPIHFGSVVGSVEDAQRFVKLLKTKVHGVILLKN